MKPLPALFSLLWIIFTMLGCSDAVVQEEAVSTLPVPVENLPPVQETEVVPEEKIQAGDDKNVRGGHGGGMSHQEHQEEMLKVLAKSDHRFKGITVEQMEMLWRGFDMMEERVAGYEEFNERMSSGEVTPFSLGHDEDDEDDSMNRMIFFLETMDEEGLTEYLTSFMQDMVDLSLAQ